MVRGGACTRGQHYVLIQSEVRRQRGESGQQCWWGAA